MPLSDREVIATFMEGPKPVMRGGVIVKVWWVERLTDSLASTEWRPREITLNECHEVEARLSEEQWRTYDDRLCDLLSNEMLLYSSTLRRRAIHADAETKIRALAAVLLAEVERQGGKQQ